MSSVPFEELTMSPSSSPEASATNGSLSDSQEKTLSLLAAGAGLLSIFGSSLIIFRVVKNRKSTTPYDRIMFGLSCCDIVASLTFALSPFLIPASTSTRVWAIGNQATCTLLGAMQQFSFSAVFYNGVLAFYYFMTVRKGVKRLVFARRYEPYLHFFTIFFFSATALSGVIVGFYNEMELGFGCWIKEYPENCEANDNCISQYLGWVFGAIPFLLVFFGLPIVNASIYMYVRKSLTENKHNTAVAQQTERIREVATQGFLYVGTFYTSYTAAFIVKVVESFDIFQEADIFPLLVLNSFLPQLQGFFNCWIYLRPNWRRLKMAYPDESNAFIFKRAIVDSDIPPLVTSGAAHSTPVNSNRYSKRSNPQDFKELSPIREEADNDLIMEQGSSSLAFTRGVLPADGRNRLPQKPVESTESSSDHEHMPVEVSVDTPDDEDVKPPTTQVSQRKPARKLSPIRRITMDGGVNVLNGKPLSFHEVFSTSHANSAKNHADNTGSPQQTFDGMPSDQEASYR